MASLMMYAIERSLHTLRLVEMTVGGMLSRDDWRVFVIPSVAEGSREISPRAALSRHDMLDFSTTLDMTWEELMPRTLSWIGC